MLTKFKDISLYNNAPSLVVRDLVRRVVTIDNLGSAANYTYIPTSTLRLWLSRVRSDVKIRNIRRTANGRAPLQTYTRVMHLRAPVIMFNTPEILESLLVLSVALVVVCVALTDLQARQNSERLSRNKRHHI